MLKISLALASRFLFFPACAFAISSTAAADSFPSKPITLVVGFAAGGGTDIQARALARAAAKELGQPIIIENRPGVSATLAPSAIAHRSAPDGYTLAVTPATLFRIPHLMKVNFDPLKDFTFIANISSFSYSLSIAEESRWKTVQDLFAYAKANPGKISFGNTGVGGTGHVTASRLAKLAGLEVNAVPFKSSGEVYTALIGGHVDFAAEAGFGAMLDGGKIRSLGVFAEERLKNRPDLPTMKEQGYDIVAKSSWGIGGPKGMDPQVVKRLSEAFRKATSDAAFRAVLDREDQPLTYMDSEKYTAYARELFAEEGRFVRDLGIAKTE